MTPPQGIALLEQALRIKSLTGQEHQLAEHLRVDMEARGFAASVDGAGNAVGVIGSGPRKLVLMGHMDTVPGDVPIRYEDGALYGRGAVDAKGPLCCFILAAEAAKGAIEASDWQVIVIGATEEESAYSKGANHAASRYTPEMCIIGEPSGSTAVTLGYKGRLLVEASFQRGSQHTAAPGPSVSESALWLWEHIRGYSQTFNEGKERAFDQILPSLRRVTSHDDGLLEVCQVTVGLRLPLDFSPQDMEREVRAWLERAKESLFPPGLSFSFRFIGPEAAWVSEKTSPLARAFVTAIRAEKVRPAFKYKTGTADFNVVGPLWGCPIVAYGPGDSSLDHTPNEHVPIEEFDRGVRVLERALKTLVSEPALALT
jgi:[amino group carrier protein]-lysine/ornithine hydrolase